MIQRIVFWMLCCLAPLPLWAHGGVALGTGAAFAPDAALWIVQAQEVARTPWPDAPEGSVRRAVHQLVARRSADAGKTWSAPRPLLPTPEPIAADGENRPKIAFGKDGLVVISWTRPTSPRYTGDVRLLRSTDGGAHWSAPQTVHADQQRITHRFDSIAFDDEGRLYVMWIDKRDQHHAGSGYVGAAIYAAVSRDGGVRFDGDIKLADHSCECCRIALSFDPAARKMRALWRHVFAPNERDFMLATFGAVLHATLERATQDRWAVDACPHHGGALAIAADGTQHRVWFNVIENEGRSFYARIPPDSGALLPTQVRRPGAGRGPIADATHGAPACAGATCVRAVGVEPTPDAQANAEVAEVQEAAVRQLPTGAQHADVIATAKRVVVAWKVFDGTNTQLNAWVSSDAGQHFAERPLASTSSASDAPRLVAQGERVWAVWATADSTQVLEVQP